MFDGEEKEAGNFDVLENRKAKTAQPRGRWSRWNQWAAQAVGQGQKSDATQPTKSAILSAAINGSMTK